LNFLFPHLPFDGFFTLNKHRLAYLLFNQRKQEKLRTLDKSYLTLKHAASAQPRQTHPTLPGRTLGAPNFSTKTHPSIPKREIHGLNNGR
jgi:hypothetical protein